MDLQNGLPIKKISVIGMIWRISFSPEDCDFSRPVSLIAFHGTQDSIIPYQGGSSAGFGLPFPVVTGWIESWAVKNGCDPAPIELPGVGNVDGIRYASCDENAEVLFYTIQGGGHSWPGGEPMPEWIVGKTTQDIGATEVMWNFFFTGIQIEAES
jgi:polyhydroxybutyrate depolymerase